jgi:glutamate-5-semialdehyde dehydrogenase
MRRSGAGFGHAWDNSGMNALNIAEYMQTLGLQARAASAAMARADAARKSQALRRLASLLRENVAALQVENAKDLERAVTAGLSAPMVDRLKLTPKVIETVAEGCDQLATMPDIIGEILGMKQQPSGIRPKQNHRTSCATRGPADHAGRSGPDR